MAIERGFRVIQVDECVINKNTLPTHAWSRLKTDAKIDMREAYMKPKAVILAVSREKGLDHVEVFNFSITASKFKVFLDNLRSKYMFEDIMLMIDNLNLHKSNEMKDRMDELGFRYTYTPIYSPDYNGGVESAIGLGKKIIKQERLDAIFRNE